VIARLRARHRRAWAGLAVVLPALLAVGLVGRRGEAARQEVPAALLELEASDEPTAPVPDSDGPWGWTRDPRSSDLVLVAEQRFHESWLTPLPPDVLLYWSRHPTGEILAWVHRDSPRDDAEWQRLRDDLAESPLPADALFLGRWDGRGTGRFVLPGPIDVSAARLGVIVWYSLGWSRVVAAEGAPGTERVPP